MKDLIFYALAALSLSVAVLRAAYTARTAARDAATRKRQTGVLR
jgi:hypothetical protein